MCRTSNECRTSGEGEIRFLCDTGVSRLCFSFVFNFVGLSLQRGQFCGRLEKCTPTKGTMVHITFVIKMGQCLQHTHDMTVKIWKMCQLFSIYGIPICIRAFNVTWSYSAVSRSISCAEHQVHNGYFYVSSLIDILWCSNNYFDNCI